MIKEAKILFFLIIFFLVYPCLVNASLGISPPRQTYSFAPGQVIEITYIVLSDQPNRVLTLEVAGNDLKDFIQLDRPELVGSGGFKAVMKLPNSLPKPGENSAIIWVKESVSEEEGIATTLNAGAVIVVNVPYPGKYAEVSLNVLDGNIDELIPYYIDVVNKGEEDITIETSVSFYTKSGERVHEKEFAPAFLASGKKKEFKDNIDSANYKAGDYLAELIVSYEGEERRVNDTFRIGSLFVNITNYTREIVKGGIKKYEVEVESKWNIDIPDVFAEVEISDESGVITTFQTPSINLVRWEKEDLIGYIETDELDGEYSANITVNYAGTKNTIQGTLKISPPVNVTMIVTTVIAIVASLLVIIVTLVIIRKMRRNSKKSKASQVSVKRKKYKKSGFRQ